MERILPVRVRRSAGRIDGLLMREGSARDVPVRRRPLSYALASFTVALGLSVVSGHALAAGSAGPTRSLEVGASLASSDVLSDTAMAQQTGTGLRPPAIVPNEQSGAPRVLLWDELRIAPMMAPVTSGMTTGGSAQ